MERMDRVRGVAGVAWVAAGVLLSAWWLSTGRSLGAVSWVLTALAAASAAAYLFGGARATWWTGRGLVVLLGLELLGAVADRFGLLGGPTSASVSWGTWSAFVADTERLLPWWPSPDLAAVAATVAELALGVLLIAGWWWRWVGKATAGLFAVYLLTMLTSATTAWITEYVMPVQIGAALLASARGARVQRKDRDVIAVVPA